MSTRAPTIDLGHSLWKVCEKILDVLESFNSATFHLSGVYYPTSHIFMVEAINIVGLLDISPFEPIEDEDEDEAQTRKYICDSMEIMRNKWLDYYKEIPMIYLVACVLDPRCKLNGLRDLLIAYYTSLQILDYNNISNRIDEVKKQMVDIYYDIARKYNIEVPNGGGSSNPVETKKRRGWNVFFNLQNNQGVEMTNDSSQELECYLSRSGEVNPRDPKFDLLLWWRNQKILYPVLSMVAKQILASPCSTVAVEQAFSAGGNILDEQRSNLLPESLEMQTCLDDWTRAIDRNQEIDRTNYEFFDDEGDTTTTANED